MSPRIALTTACSDSPSKLKVVSPVVPPRFGGGEAATALSIVRPVPRRICACGRPASPSARASADTGPAAVPAWPASGARAPSRLRLGAGMVEQPASTVANRAAANALDRKRGFMRCTLRFLAGRGGLQRVLPQFGAPGLDALADGVDLLGRGAIVRVRGVGRRLVGAR